MKGEEGTGGVGAGMVVHTGPLLPPPYKLQLV
jgi:hypothetical protein